MNKFNIKIESNAMIKINILFKNKEEFNKVIKLSTISKFEILRDENTIRIEICINYDTHIYKFNIDEIHRFKIERIN